MKRTRMLTLLAVSLIALAYRPFAIAKPPLTVLEHPSPKQLEQGFQQWAEEYPGRFRLEQRGVTPEGQPWHRR